MEEKELFQFQVHKLDSEARKLKTVKLKHKPKSFKNARKLARQRKQARQLWS